MLPIFTYKVDAALQAASVDDDADEVAVAKLPNRPARQRCWPDVTGARARRDPGEPRVGQYGHVAAKLQGLERAGHLVDLFHPRPHRPAADEHEHVARPRGARLDRGDSGVLGGE